MHAGVLLFAFTFSLYGTKTSLAGDCHHTSALSFSAWYTVSFGPDEQDDGEKNQQYIRKFTTKQMNR